jgi:hypothetical protein
MQLRLKGRSSSDCRDILHNCDQRREADAHIATAQHRFWRRAVKMWTDMHTLPETHPPSTTYLGM